MPEQEKVVVGVNSEVSLHFALRLDSGELIDSNFEGAAATFRVGDGSLLPGFERCLLGLTEGARDEVELLPEAAFGQANANNIQQIARKQFAPDMELSAGLVVSFADAAGAELPGVVRDWNDEIVTVDFNHPLAGRSIVFEFHILAVREGDVSA